MEIGKVVRTFVSYLLMFVLFVFYIIPFLIILLIPMKYRLKSRIIAVCMHFFYWASLKCVLVPITYIGLENMPQGPVILAANHQSALDIPLVGKIAGYTPHVWLATSELLQSLAYRYWLHRLAIMVNTSSVQQAVRSLISTIRVVEDNECHVIIFPEGQRYSDDQVHEFFGGFVILAKKLNRPIVPVCIMGANKVYPRNSFWVHYHQIKVVVGAPMHYREDDTDETFKQRVYEWFVDLVGAA